MLILPPFLPSGQTGLCSLDIVALLTKATQDQQKVIEYFKTKNQEFEERFNKIENLIETR